MIDIGENEKLNLISVLLNRVGVNYQSLTIHVEGSKAMPMRIGREMQLNVTLNGGNESFSVEHIMFVGDEELHFYGQKRDGSLGRLRHRVKLEAVYAITSLTSNLSVVWPNAMPKRLQSQPLVSVKFGSGLASITELVAPCIEAEPTHVPYLRLVR